jgi:YVTN family beta-propeller protein
MPFMSAAAESYGQVVLAEVPQVPADEASSLGRLLLAQVFGTRAHGEPLPGPVSALVSDPGSEDAQAEVLLATRRLLAADPVAAARVRSMLVTGPGVNQFARGDRDVLAAGRDLLVTNIYYRKGGGRSSGVFRLGAGNVLPGVVAALGLAAALLALHWPLFRVASVATLVIAGTVLWISRSRSRSWRGRPMVATVGICVTACAVLASAFSVRAISASPAGPRLGGSSSPAVNALPSEATGSALPPVPMGTGAANALAATIGVGEQPEGVAVDPATHSAYVTNIGGDSVSVIDTATNTVTATIGVGNGPDSVAVDPVTRTAYVTNWSDDSVAVISTG